MGVFHLRGRGVDVGVGRWYGDDRSRLDEVLAQLCGELLLLTPALAQPHLRGGDGIGLELLDLLFSPDHVLRVDETLTLLDATRLGRRMSIDIALDRLAPQQEHAAAQLGTFIDERAVRDGPYGGVLGTLWLPLLLVPRPLVPIVEIKDAVGRLLPRPRQRDVRAVLVATAYHLFRNAFSKDHVGPEHSVALAEFDRRDHAARWLVQTALIQLSKDGRNSARSVLRTEKLGSRGVLQPGVVRPDLAKLIDSEDDEHRRNALIAVQEVIAPDDALLGVIDLFYSNYFVVVGLDRKTRHHHVECLLPDVEAIDRSSARFWRHHLRAFDPREHNFTVRAHIPVPLNVQQYRLNVDTASAQTAEPLSVSLLAAVHFMEHPVQPALATTAICAEVLEAAAASLEASRSVEPDRGNKLAAYRARYAAAEAHSSLETMGRLAGRRDRAAAELDASRPGMPRIAPVEAIKTLKDVADVAREHVNTAQERTRSVMSGGPDTLDTDLVRQTSQAVTAARDALQDPLIGVATVGDEVPGGEVARMRLNQRDENDRQPRAIDAWITASDECRSYAVTHVGPPLLIASLLYLIGAFVLREASWLWALDRSEVADKLTDARPVGIASLLLLVPAFALTHLHVPNQRDVAGVLRRPARMLVAAAIGALYVSAVVLATLLSASSASRTDVDVVSWTLRFAVGGFLVWFLWSLWAWATRGRRVWHPKGLATLFVDLGTDHRRRLRTRRRRRRLPLLLRFGYDRKIPDTTFDLTQPAGHHRKRGRPS